MDGFPRGAMGAPACGRGAEGRGEGSFMNFGAFHHRHGDTGCAAAGASGELGDMHAHPLYCRRCELHVSSSSEGPPRSG